MTHSVLENLGILVNHLQKAWKIATIDAASSDQPIALHTDKNFKIATLGVHQSDLAAIRSALLIVLDMVYVSHADSSYSMHLDDPSLVDSEILFCERHFKQKQIEKLAYHYRRFPVGGFPDRIPLL